MRFRLLTSLSFLIVITISLGGTRALQHEHGHGGIPAPLKAEHAELHARLDRAIGSGGSTAEAARKLAEVLHPHFVKEESYALPQLGHLKALSAGGAIAGNEDVIKLADKLKAEMPKMLKEHQSILEAIEKLSGAAAAENKKEFVEFAENLKHHAQMEEEIFYPTSILIGEYLKLKKKVK
jgi:hypothetical protein